MLQTERKQSINEYLKYMKKIQISIIRKQNKPIKKEVKIFELYKNKVELQRENKDFKYVHHYQA